MHSSATSHSRVCIAPTAETSARTAPHARETCSWPRRTGPTRQRSAALSHYSEPRATGWVLGHPFGKYLIDIAFPEAMLAVEIDGWAWHMGVDRFRADRHKGNALVRARWDLLRFTWYDLTNRPDYVVAEIRTGLAARSDR